MRKLTNEQGLAIMYNHYGNEINSICDRVEFRQGIGIQRTEEDVSKTNEELFKLLMYRKNIKDLLIND